MRPQTRFNARVLRMFSDVHDTLLVHRIVLCALLIWAASMTAVVIVGWCK